MSVGETYVARRLAGFRRDGVLQVVQKVVAAFLLVGGEGRPVGIGVGDELGGIDSHAVFHGHDFVLRDWMTQHEAEEGDDDDREEHCEMHLRRQFRWWSVERLYEGLDWICSVVKGVLCRLEFVVDEVYV